MNICVYFRPQYQRWCAHLPHRSRLWILRQILNGGDIDQVVRRDRQQRSPQPQNSSDDLGDNVGRTSSDDQIGDQGASDDGIAYASGNDIEMSCLEEDVQQQDVLWIPATPDRSAQDRVHQAIGRDAQKYTVTCQVKIDTHNDGWRLTSLDCHGAAKTQGGDEFYIEYYHSYLDQQISEDHTLPTAVALIEDCGDGTYLLDFSATPTNPVPPPPSKERTATGATTISSCGGGGGMLRIYFEYSCGLGTMAPPAKKDWENGGYTHARFEIQLSRPPPIRPFVPPNIHPSLQEAVVPSVATHILPSRLDLTQFDIIVAIGDSTMEQLIRQRPNNKGKYFFQPNLTFGDKVSNGLNTTTVDGFLESIDQQYGPLLRQDASSQPKQNVALLVGSCLWDILDSSDTRQGVEYLDHQQACRIYLERLREAYPNVTVFWKSPTAVHIHVVDLDRLHVSKMGQAALFGIERLRYMSASRSRYLYQIQKQIVKELQQQHKQITSNTTDDNMLHFLDLYEATYLSAAWLFPSDGRHYRPNLNRLMLQWYYPPPKIHMSCDATRADDDKKDYRAQFPYYRDATYDAQSFLRPEVLQQQRQSTEDSLARGNGRKAELQQQQQQFAATSEENTSRP